MLKNPYVRIAIAAGISTLVAPKIAGKLITPELSPADGIQNNVAIYGVAGATAAFVFVLLSMTLGAPAAA